MYICKPERNINQVRLLLWGCVILTAGIFLVSTLIQQYSSVVKMMGIISLMASIWLNVRYSLTEYEYMVSNGDFSVVRIVGNRRETVCCVALSTAISLLEKRDYEHLPSNEKAVIKYFLNQNIKAQSYVFLCEFNGKRAMIEFEPNDAFVTIMKKEISYNKPENYNKQ